MLVEGTSDLHVLMHLLDRHCVRVHDPNDPSQRDSDEQEFDITIKQAGGISELLKQVLPTMIRDANGKDVVIGVVVDANADTGKRWKEIVDRIRGVDSYVLPERPCKEGTIVSPPDGTLLPRVGVWMMPDNRSEGEIEDFLKFLVPKKGDSHKLYEHVKSSVGSIPSPARFKNEKRSKAELHTWLAWQRDPGTPMGLAIKKQYLDSGVPQADNLVAWVRRLFSLPSP